MPNRVPYFYIIEQKNSHKKYAGAKWGIGANPDRFLTGASGYTTSSKAINKIFNEVDDINFSILEIILENEINSIPFGCQTIEEYESWYIAENNCNISLSWFNKHKSTNVKPHDSIEVRASMMKTYGVEYARQIPGNAEKVTATKLEKYGPSLCKDSNARSAKIRKTKLEKYGDAHYTNTEQWMKTNNIKFGGNSPPCDINVVNKAKETYQEKYGGNSSMCDPDVKALRELTWKEKYGGHPMKTEKTKQNRKDNCMKKYGYPNHGIINYVCEHCGSKGKGLGNYKRYHHNNCKLNINKVFNEIYVGLLLFPFAEK